MSRRRLSGCLCPQGELNPAAALLLLCSYMLVDNFQRGIFKWPLVFGWSPLPEAYIQKHNLTVSDPIRYGSACTKLLFHFELRPSERTFSSSADVPLWLEAFSPSTESTSTSSAPTTPAWTCGVERTWKFPLRHSPRFPCSSGGPVPF